MSGAGKKMWVPLLALMVELMLCPVEALALSYVVSGVVTEADGKTPIEFASVEIEPGQQWDMTDSKGQFALRVSHGGTMVIKISCVGYETVRHPVEVTAATQPVHVALAATNLLLDQVVVTARRKTENATTSYLIDRQALDNQQIVNVSDMATLLPGGKTVNSTLMTDTRLALRAGEGEKGNASFGTAIEVDGQRLQNNADPGETGGASTRTIASASVANIEVVPGIPSVEYGDLSNGIVKVNTKQGHTPWEITLATNPHTKQVAVSKGLDVGPGMLNASLEHTRSYSSLASPHTAYQRNTLGLVYRATTSLAGRPLVLGVNVNGNAGGYNSKADPDQFVDTYTRTRDLVLRGAVNADWNPGAAWLSSLSVHADFSLADKRRTTQSNDNSSSAQPQIHALEEGYFIATEYDENPAAPIILGPTGYWYVKSFRDNRPRSTMLKLKAKWNHRAGRLTSRLMAGVEWTATGNGGRGTYYNDMRYAPTWREYRYDRLPWMHNMALYGEERVHLALGDHGGLLQLTAGVRDDITHIAGSQYGTISTVSPRFNLRYTAWERRDDWVVNRLSVYGGWGKSVKLPSFEVLYPAPAYADRMAFTPASTVDNKAFYAYSVTPFKPLHNPGLKWQYAQQAELGLEVDARFASISLSAFYNKTCRPYLRTSVYSPFSYRYTSQASLEGDFPIASANRLYSIDRTTGVVTVEDRTGQVSPLTLDYQTRNTFNANYTYVNGSAITRSGMDWVIDFKPVTCLRTSLRIDGSYYHYHGVEHTLIASMPSGARYMSDGITPYQYVGYYQGTAQGGLAYATVPNGSVTDVVNNNVTIITHIPAIRLVISLRLESTLYDSRRSLSEGAGGAPRGYVLDDPADYFGTPYTGAERDCYVALWPEYYTTWNQPDVKVPFAERFIWARDHDSQLFNELAAMVVKTNYNYNLNPDRISAYVSGNINITKEIGNHVSVSFLANNFWNSMARVKSRQTGLRTTIYNAGYIPPFYYGLSVRVKL